MTSDIIRQHCIAANVGMVIFMSHWCGHWIATNLDMVEMVVVVVTSCSGLLVVLESG